MTLAAVEGRIGHWEGLIKPADREYRLRIVYEVPHAPENFSAVRCQPRVQVLEPLLEAHKDFEEGPIPHVYNNKANPALPFLCLFDPYKAEWTPADLLADTTVPWAARYLYFYEGWLLTRRWMGGGRHPTPAELGGGASRPGKVIA
jgi:hypothetical protein